MKIHLKWSTARVIAATGDTVEPGGDADVPKELADSLCEQQDVWGKGSSKKKKTDSEDA